MLKLTYRRGLTHAGLLVAAVISLIVHSGSNARPLSPQEQVGSIPLDRRTVHFSGYEWGVRNSTEPETPDSNYFSDSDENVWVDTTGLLHLRIAHRDGRWFCAEVVLKRSLGHGLYVFHVASRIGELNMNVVLGLFHYDYQDTYPFHRETDIEFSKWGMANSPNAQYVIQPWELDGNLHRWMMPVSVDSSTHTYYWATDSIHFLSARGYQSLPPFDSILGQWTYSRTTSVPMPGQERVRLNLWLSQARPPSDSAEPEVIIAGFEHIPDPLVRRRPAISLPGHRLMQNQPNPFRVGTSLRYELKSAEAVTIRIFDTCGRSVRTLVDKNGMPGIYESYWDGLDTSGKEAHSGIYMCHMTVGQTQETIQLIRVR